MLNLSKTVKQKENIVVLHLEGLCRVYKDEYSKFELMGQEWNHLALQNLMSICAKAIENVLHTEKKSK